MTELESISSRCQEFRNQQTALKQKQEQQRLERMRQDSISRLPAKAEEELLLIYRILEEQDSEDARDRFIESQDLLETWLEKEAYRTISELLEPSESPNPSTPQLAVSPDPSPSPSPDSPVTPARESAPSETAMSQRPDSPTQPLGPRPEPDGSVFFSSLPPHAVVYMDGHQIGLTNSGDIAITSGTHRMHFVRGDKTCTREMTFTPGKNPTVMITLPCQK